MRKASAEAAVCGDVGDRRGEVLGVQDGSQLSCEARGTRACACGVRGRGATRSLDADCCFAPDFATGIATGFKQHPRVSTTTGGPSSDGRRDPRCRWGWETSEAVLDPAAEVRDLPQAGAPGGGCAHMELAPLDLALPPSTGGSIGASSCASARWPRRRLWRPSRSPGSGMELEAARADAGRLGEALKEMALERTRHPLYQGSRRDTSRSRGHP